MADGSVEMNAWIAKLRKLGTIVEDAAPEVARELEGVLGAQIAAGVGPDGTPWKLTAEGRKALVGARKSLSVRAIGSVVLVRLEGVEARHHLGAVKGGVKREIIPTGKLPDAMTMAIRKVYERRFAKTMGVSS